MRDFFSFSREDNKRLADAFTTIADVFELVGGRTVSVERTHDTAEPNECDHDTAEPIEHDDDAAEPIERTHADAELERVLGPRPRKPMPAQFRYCSDHVKAMLAQNPSLCYVEIRKLTAAQWYTTSEEERQKYRDRYSALKNQYHIDIAAYNSRVQALIAAAYGIPETPDAIDELLERELGPKPKRPMSSFSIYLSSATKEIREEDPGILWNEAKNIADLRWKNLSKEDRQPFRDRYDALKKQYKIDKATYEAREMAFLSDCHRSVSMECIVEPEHSALSTLPGPSPHSTEQLGEGEGPAAADDVLGRELGPKPKRPRGAHHLYRSSISKEIRKENPGIRSKDVERISGIWWKNLSNEDRQPFKDRCDALNRQYKIDKAEYDVRKEVFLSAYRKSVSAVRLVEPEHSALSASPRPPSQPTEQLGEGEGPAAADDVLERELGPKPKRPGGAHHLYRSSVSMEIRKENPGIRAKDVERISDLRWKTLSKEERQPFKDRYDALSNQYKIDKAEYDVRKEACLSAYRKSVSTVRLVEPEHSALSTSPQPLPQPTEQLGGEGGPTAADDVLERELGPKPKRPLCAHHLYRRSAIPDIRGDTPGLDWQEAQRLSDLRWKNLSEEDRQPFKDRYRALSEQYRIDKAAYDARKGAFLKGAKSNLREHRNNSVANPSSTARSSQHPAPSISPGPPPRPIERRNEPEHTTASASSGYTGLFSSQPPPLSIESVGPLVPVGYPTSSHPILPSGTASWPTIPLGLPWPALTPTPVSWPTLPLAPIPWPVPPSGPISWPAEVTLPDEPSEPTSLPASSGDLPGPTMPIRHSTTPTPASATTTAPLTQPVIMPESIPVGMRPMSLEFPEVTETVAFVGSPDLSFISDPPAPDVKPSVESAEPVELVTPKTNSKKKKKKKRAADDDEPGADQSTSSHRKKAKRAKGDAKEGKKKKHKQRIVVKTEDNIQVPQMSVPVA
ncbi:hypothetical protein GGI09_002079 [Coemansia sp. S100]|nr:hypothetical protein GGI09_002079 [Coemansia sp. S100]